MALKGSLFVWLISGSRKVLLRRSQSATYHSKACGMLGGLCFYYLTKEVLNRTDPLDCSLLQHRRFLPNLFHSTVFPQRMQSSFIPTATTITCSLLNNRSPFLVDFGRKSLNTCSPQEMPDFVGNQKSIGRLLEFHIQYQSS